MLMPSEYSTLFAPTSIKLKVPNVFLNSSPIFHHRYLLHERKAMSTATHSAAAAALEVWGATMKRYRSAAGIVLLYYDWLHTLDDEVCLILSSLYCLTACSGSTFLANSPLLHYSLSNHHCIDIFQLPLVS